MQSLVNEILLPLLEKSADSVCRIFVEPNHNLLPVALIRACTLAFGQSLRAGKFYEIEVLRGDWSVRQLNRQINFPSYEHAALSENKAAMLDKGLRLQANDTALLEEAITDPYILEFLN